MNYPELVRKVLGEGKVRYYETRSSGVSMFPTIWPNSTLRAEYAPIEDIKSGDIIIFQRKESLVAHRVVEVGEGYLRTQGDSCRIKDEVITANNYLCKVVRFVLFKKMVVTEKSLYWRYHKWLFINFSGIHMLNNVYVTLIVKIAQFLGIKYPKD